MKYFHEPNHILEMAIDRFFHVLTVTNNERYNGQLSILLLGSLSRGEATWTYKDNQLVLLSDIEFFTFYPQGFSDFPFFDNEIKKAAAQIKEEIGSSLFHVDNTWISKGKISKLERKLLVFDAQEMGITVVGEDLKKRLPLVTIKNINLEDIGDIITHRVFSVLYYGSKMPHTDECYEYRYLLAKNSLDLMTVLLVKNGKLISGFENRMHEVEKLQIDDSDIAYYQYCLSIKNGAETSSIFHIEEMEDTFIRLCEELARGFRIPITNRMINFRTILRRRAGMAKRAILIKHFPNSRATHLGKLINIFRGKRKLDEKNLKDNFVLNGYPGLNNL